MSKKILNTYARRTVDQINSTLDLLQNNSLCIFYNDVSPVDDTQIYCRITWRNHVPGRVNSGDSFNKLAQYRHILDTNSYHCLLFDGSLVRVNFEFYNNLLITQNLLWWPTPYDYGDIVLEGFTPVEVIDDFYGDNKWYEKIKMRSPIRIDFDSTNNTENHPHSHMHIEHAETRINTVSPICFNRFIDFIFRNFYPEISFPLSKYDFIYYNIPDLEIIDYINSKVTI